MKEDYAKKYAKKHKSKYAYDKEYQMKEDVKQEGRRQQCINKDKYVSKRIAEINAERISVLAGHPLFIYKCHLCKQWHLTKKDNTCENKVGYITEKAAWRKVEVHTACAVARDEEEIAYKEVLKCETCGLFHIYTHPTKRYKLK